MNRMDRRTDDGREKTAAPRPAVSNTFIRAIFQLSHLVGSLTGSVTGTAV